MFELGIIPIINGGSLPWWWTRSRFGDNDNLSAADHQPDRGGVFSLFYGHRWPSRFRPEGDSPCPEYPSRRRIDAVMEEIVGERKARSAWEGSSVRSSSKKASHFGIPTVVARGTKEGVLHQILKGKEIGTLILPPKGEALSSRKHWIAFNPKPKGNVIVDEGAKKAIVQKGKSLLPSGVVKIRGDFDRGDLVTCLGPRGKEFARGLVNYRATELEKIKGLRSNRSDRPWVTSIRMK